MVHTLLHTSKEMEKLPLYDFGKQHGADRKPRLSTWRTGFWRRFLHTGVIALIAATIASISMVYIIRTSDGQPIASWRYQPTVCLAISYTIANMTLQCTLARAVTIAWWTKALKGDAKVQDLHNIWSYGHGVCQILLLGRFFNLVALAGLVVTLAPINGPLLQRASVIHECERLCMKNITIPIAPEFPGGYTGIIAGHGGEAPASLTVSFSDIMKQHTNRLAINITNSGCEGSCKGTLFGAGYDISCTEDTAAPYLISLNLTDHGSLSLDYDFFWSNFISMDEHNLAAGSYTHPKNITNVMTFTAVYKDTSTCSGALNRTTCTLRPQPSATQFTSSTTPSPSTPPVPGKQIRRKSYGPRCSTDSAAGLPTAVCIYISTRSTSPTCPHAGTERLAGMA
jgi:hypothetical protein